MASLGDLPTEIKIEVLKALPCLDALYSLCLTSSEFYHIATSKQWLWDLIHRSVWSNEVAGSVALRGLIRLKRFKMRRSPRQQATEFPGPQDEWEGTPEAIHACGLYYHRTIEWFSKEFLRHQFQVRDAEKHTRRSRDGRFKPTHSELLRVGDAFTLLWYAMEENTFVFDISNHTRSEEHRERLEEYALSDDKGMKQDIKSNCAILLSVYEFVRARLEILAREHHKLLSKYDRNQLKNQVACISLYHRLAVPNMILWDIGLTGVMELMHMSLAAAVRRIQPSYRFGITDSGLDKAHDIFLITFSTYAQASRKESDLRHRPLWTHPHGTYITNCNPWQQDDAFDWNAAFWDDERLVKEFGYFRMENIASRGEGDGEEDEEWQACALQLQRKKMREDCDSCKADWPCEYRAQARHRRSIEMATLRV